MPGIPYTLNLTHGILPPGMNPHTTPETNNGRVYVDTEYDKPEIKLSRTTKCEEDLEIYDYLKSLVDLTANYSVTSQNCRAFSHSAYNEIVRKLDKDKK